MNVLEYALKYYETKTQQNLSLMISLLKGKKYCLISCIKSWYAAHNGQK